MSETAIVLIGGFSAAQLCTRPLLVFGSYCLTRARISRLVWTRQVYGWPGVWLARWSRHARLSCDFALLSSLGWKGRRGVVCKRAVLRNLGPITASSF